MMGNRFTISALSRRAVRALVGMVLILGMAVAPGQAAAQADQTLGAELCAAAQGVIPAGSRIALAPPFATESPIPVPEVEAVMSRAAQAMCADWSEKPRILAGSTDLRTSLALVQARQGAEAWRDTVEATVRREADYVLVGETAIMGDNVVLRLTLVDLEDGRVLVKTSDVSLGSVARRVAGDPRAAIWDAIEQFIDGLPAAREEVTVGAFVNETSGVETALGRALREMAVEAWLDNANSITALLRDAPPARVRTAAGPETGFFLEGAIRPVNGNRFQLVLRLSQDGALRATRTLDLSALQLPDRLRRLVDPGAPEAVGLDEIERALAELGDGHMAVTARGGYNGVYPLCRTTDAARVVEDCADSLIRVDLFADRPGSLLCLSLDDSGQFFVMLPSSYAPNTALHAERLLTLPDHLPVLPDGNRVYWPAMGPPAETLVGCALYAGSPGPALGPLAGLDGKILSAEEKTRLISILRDSGPLAGGAVRVRIVD
ncbi:hypothetical protein [Antarctobacter jejuensis]|uniref:hypothetical protein n=1 Tax=Antarctobacter jejuensis TaxID=1439938 RepID=UPI003FD2028F